MLNFLDVIGDPMLWTNRCEKSTADDYWASENLMETSLLIVALTFFLAPQINSEIVYTSCTCPSVAEQHNTRQAELS